MGYDMCLCVVPWWKAELALLYLHTHQGGRAGVHQQYLRTVELAVADNSLHAGQTMDSGCPT
eukprot:33814-Pleurochrysis_carterae.AAC.2